ncbi:hydroxyacid dehydrogenase [Anaerovorax odorimutans]|uniref:Hydroxyacid dehydrogenase n=1 Tax=Anaerovorax odorimutans TaxID=109327 RepID=A0ABT1RPC6_9FIRM|nr:four-carbon acid sugar kinase family protein [Anaerovorax odorimutans]MCQ4637040.1 hydroxyacid dehydrogenase [Anaerovorax odorimutans]
MKKTELERGSVQICSLKQMGDIDHILQKEIEKNDKKLVVLDDDPTGTQTVHGVSVYTDWSKSSISAGFDEPNKLFYILTNSRAMTESETKTLHEEIGKTILAVSKEKGKDFIIISRSDSTLRGHFPLETSTLRSVLEQEFPVDGEILCPFFLEGGRLTIDDVHYVKEGENLIPAGNTEFAKDKTFGYRSSNLKAYIEEKTSGAFAAEAVSSISLEMLRNGELDKIESLLLQIRDYHKVIVNAVDYQDLKVFCTAFYRAVGKGKSFLIRSAASIVKVLGGISDAALLNRRQLPAGGGDAGGLIIVGSYAEKTTRQLNELKRLKNAVFIQFDSDCVLDEIALAGEQKRVASEAEKELKEGKTAVIFTKRQPLQVEGDTKEAVLIRSVKISDALSSIVSRVETVPRFVIAKGGITSSDIATKALKIRRATVLGQIKPGIPVWKSESEGAYKNIPYIIFPGNVGKDGTLLEVAKLLGC